jgi:hypothetical protein
MQIQCRRVVPFLVALPHRPFSFPEPSAELVPFAIPVGEPIGLLALGAFRRLVVRKRVAYSWHAVDDFDERDHALRILTAEQAHSHNSERREGTKSLRSARASGAR